MYLDHIDSKAEMSKLLILVAGSVEAIPKAEGPP